MTALLSENELDRIRQAGLILKECLEALSSEIRPGVSTKSLEETASAFIAAKKAKPAFKGYKGFPASICASLNSVVVHGIPSEKDILRKGDILSVDVGVEFDGYFADGAKTFKVGDISEEAKCLIHVTEAALYKGIEAARDGNHVGDISSAVQSFVESSGFSIVRAFVGHGIGKNIHQEPEVPNFGEPHTGKLLERGMVLAIEPMVNAGTKDIKILDDGWTAMTKDGRLSAHFEHTVIISGNAAEIVT